MALLSLEALLIYASVFAVSWFSGIFGMGGGMILLALMTLFIPIKILVPLHGLLVLPSISTRTFLHRKHIKWPLILRCGIGAIIGVVLGAFINVNIPSWLFSVLLGVLLLSIVWLPESKNLKMPIIITSIFHGIISATFGTGGLLQALFSRIKLKKYEIMATFGGIMLVLGVSKALAFTLNGFDLVKYLPVVLISFLPAFIGSFIGKYFLGKLSEKQFKKIFKYGITIIAIRLIYIGITSV